MKGKYLLFLFLFLVPAIVFGVGQAGSAVQFSGVNDAVVTVPVETDFNVLGDNYTIEAWIKPADFASTRVFAFSDSAFTFAVNTSGKLVFTSHHTTGATVTGLTTLSAGQWAHVAAVFNGATATLYVNGAVDNSASNPLFELPVFKYDILFGRALIADNMDFKGELDEIRIWKTARNSSDLAEYDRKVLPLPQANLLALYKLDDTGETVSDEIHTQNGFLGNSSLDIVYNPVRVVSTAPIGGHLLYPNSGSLAKGDPLTVTWSAAEFGSNIHVLFSSDAGQTWQYLAYNTSNDGSYQTFVPGIETVNALFRISDPADTESFDSSDALITIGSATLPDWKQEIVLEAEDGNFSGNFFPATDGKAFYSRFAYGTQNHDGWVDLSFNVPAPGGLYVVWANVWGPGSTRNSFYFSVDGGDESVWDIPKHNMWEWDRISDRGPGGVAPYWADIDPLYLNLSAGNHTVRIRKREAYARVDRLVITNDLKKIYWGQMPYRWIDFTSPVEKDSVERGKNWEITWESQNYSSDVTIKLSYDRGYTFPHTIVSGTPNDGSYTWNVPADADSSGVLFISHDGERDTYMDQTWRPFYFIDPAEQFTLLQPNGGDTLYVNEEFDIKWENTAFGGDMLIEYSPNNGTNWYPVKTVAATDSVYTWTVPATVTDQALVKITPVGNVGSADTSDATFVIMQRPVPVFALLTPNGGDTLYVSETADITWANQALGGNLLVEFSPNNGTNWYSVKTVSATDSAYTWTVPATVTEEALIKITPLDDVSRADTSDSTFIIMQRPPVINGENYALYFDGLNDLVEIPDSDSLDVIDTFTIEFMLNTENPNQSWTRIMEKGSWDEYYFGFYGPKQKLYGGLRADIGNDMTMMKVGFGPTQTVLQENTWYHVTVTYDGIYAVTYVNGEMESIYELLAKPRTTTGDLVLGAVKRFGNYYGFYQGMLDQVRIWNIALDPLQIQAGLYQQLTGEEEGLVAYYPFDEGAGQVATDMSGNGNNGRLGVSVDEDDSDPLWVSVDWHMNIDNSELMNEEELIAELPSEFVLQQNYPNPFNPSTNIAFDLPRDEHVRLTIYNVTGQQIAVLLDAPMQAGTHLMQWQAAALPSGVYIYRLEAGSFRQHKRMLLIK